MSDTIKCSRRFEPISDILCLVENISPEDFFCNSNVSLSEIYIYWALLFEVTQNAVMRILITSSIGVSDGLDNTIRILKAFYIIILNKPTLKMNKKDEIS